MKNYFLTLILSVFIADNLYAQEDVEEVVVTSSLTSSALADIEDPLHVVKGEDIDNSATQSLGETLDDLLGVSSQDYGAAVGRPVIRGMSGTRVKILNNGFVWAKNLGTWTKNKIPLSAIDVLICFFDLYFWTNISKNWL